MKNYVDVKIVRIVVVGDEDGEEDVEYKLEDIFPGERDFDPRSI